MPVYELHLAADRLRRRGLYPAVSADGKLSKGVHALAVVGMDASRRTCPTWPGYRERLCAKERTVARYSPGW